MKLKAGICFVVLLLAPTVNAVAGCGIMRTAAEMDMGDRFMKPLLVHAAKSSHVKTIRIQIPPNTDLPPHGPKAGYFIATVISGTVQIGFGHEFDASKLKTLPPGSVFYASGYTGAFRAYWQQAGGATGHFGECGHTVWIENKRRRAPRPLKPD